MFVERIRLISVRVECESGNAITRTLTPPSGLYNYYIISNFPNN